MRYKIACVGAGKMSDEDRLELARLLTKSGYTVRIGRYKPNPKSAAYVYFVEYWEEQQ